MQEDTCTEEHSKETVLMRGLASERDAPVLLYGAEYHIQGTH